MAKHIRRPDGQQGAQDASSTAPFARVNSASSQPPRSYDAGDAFLRPAASYQPPSVVDGGPRTMELPKKKQRKKHRFLKFLLTLLVLVLAAVGAYTLMLNSRLALEGSTASEVVAQLTDRIAGEPYYVLVLGSDKRDASQVEDASAYPYGEGHSDIIVLLRIDERNRQVTMLTIPRDTPVTWEAGGRGKISEVYQVGGPAASIKEVSRITGVPISHYVEVHIDGFVDLVDELGGVVVDVPTQLTVVDAVTGETVTVEAGTQTLNGQQAQVVARARHEYENGDADRQSMVRQIMTSVLTSVAKRPIQEIPGAVLSVASHVDTDMNAFSIASLGSALGLGSGITVYTGTGPTEGDLTESGLWLCYENPAGWRAVMDVVEAGGDPSTVDANAYLGQ